MGFYACNHAKIERDKDRRGERVFRASTYDEVSSAWTHKEFPHSTDGLAEALRWISESLMQLDM